MQKLINKKEEQYIPAPMANIYDNTALFKRETIESKIENHPMMSNASGPA